MGSYSTRIPFLSCSWLCSIFCNPIVIFRFSCSYHVFIYSSSAVNSSTTAFMSPLPAMNSAFNCSFVRYVFSYFHIFVRLASPSFNNVVIVFSCCSLSVALFLVSTGIKHRPLYVMIYRFPQISSKALPQIIS